MVPDELKKLMPKLKDMLEEEIKKKKNKKQKAKKSNDGKGSLKKSPSFRGQSIGIGQQMANSVMNKNKKRRGGSFGREDLLLIQQLTQKNPKKILKPSIMVSS